MDDLVVAHVTHAVDDELTQTALRQLPMTSDEIDVRPSYVGKEMINYCCLIMTTKKIRPKIIDLTTD